MSIEKRYIEPKKTIYQYFEVNRVNKTTGPNTEETHITKSEKKRTKIMVHLKQLSELDSV
jgi:hypothetical protein